jgi:hypothetical protein
MLVLPIRRTNPNRRTGVKSFKGERFQFLHSQLVRTNQALQVGLDGQSLGFCNGFSIRDRDEWRYS